MKFTKEQYDLAIEALINARQQLIDGTQNRGCDVCGGACHPDQCRFNPLHAQHLCQEIANHSTALHDTLHYLSGYETLMGESVGPHAVVIQGKQS